MAQDWIKMRCELQTHPKIVRILSATRADKFRVIGGLHAVWSVFDTHSVDGSLKGYTPELLDHVIGWEGFARAMESVGWLLFDGLETLTLPEFTEHNGQSAKRRAEDQKRKRDARRSPQSVREDCGQNADEKRTREEKRREEDKKHKGGASAPDLFPSVDPVVVADFKRLRAQKKAPITLTAVEGIKREAAKAGYTLEQALRTCCERGWTGFKAEWVAGQVQSIAVDRAQLPGGGRRAL